MKKIRLFLKNLKNPEGIKSLPVIKTKGYFNYMYFTFILIFSFGILFTILKKTSPTFSDLIASKNLIRGNKIFYLLKLIIIYPIIEEYGFRLNLKVNRRNLSAGFSIQIFYFLVLFNKFDLNIIINLLLSILSFPILFYLINLST